MLSSAGRSFAEPVGAVFWGVVMFPASGHQLLHLHKPRLKITVGCVAVSWQWPRRVPP